MTLAEQVAELERERDALRGGLRECERQFQEKCGEIARLLDAVASAKAEGAREAEQCIASRERDAFAAGADWYIDEGWKSSMYGTARNLEAARRYPAPASGEPVREDSCNKCGRSREYRCDCLCPTPPSAPEPLSDTLTFTPDEIRERIASLRKLEIRGNAGEAEGVYVRRTDVLYALISADARRIVGMGRGGTDA